MRSGKRRMTPRSNQGQPWKGWIFWSGLQERKRGFWIDSRQSFLNPEAVSNSTQCFALGWDSAPSPWPDSNLATAAGAAAIWRSTWADYTTLVRKYSQVPDTGSSPWCCYWYWRQPLCFFNPPLPSLSPTKMERWHCQTFMIRPSWSWSQVWQCDNPFYQKLAPLEWQKECAGKIIFFYLSSVLLESWSTFSFSYLILQASFFQSENLPLTKDTDPLLWKMAPFSSQSIELLLFSSYKIPSSD